MAAKPAAAKVATVTKTTTKVSAKSERNYDCSKAGNKNKAACKTAAAPVKPMPVLTPAKPAVAKSAPVKPMAASAQARVAPAAAKPASARPTAAAPAARNYDCTKAGNANKTVCKAAVATRPAPVAKPKAAASGSSDDKNPVGAIGRCRDGMYSHSKQRVGACSHHGGVAQWS